MRHGVINSLCAPSGPAQIEIKFLIFYFSDLTGAVLAVRGSDKRAVVKLTDLVKKIIFWGRNKIRKRYFEQIFKRLDFFGYGF